ncbi:MAG: lysylphosphatidylglycerol synthase transmembrane domain-containing protein [Candidatus Bipolaricaulia bacterium]
MLSVLVGVAIVLIILQYVGWGNVVREFTALGWLGFLAFTVDITLTILLWTLSWRIILNAYGIRRPWSRVFQARLSGFAITYLTPSLYLGGEPVRAYLLADERSSPARLLATVIVERFLAGLSLICFIYLGIFHLIASETLPFSQKSLILLAVFSFSLINLLIFLNFSQKRLWFTRLMAGLRKYLPGKRFLERAEEVARQIENDIHKAFKHHARQTLVAFIVHLIATFFMYLRPQIFFYFTKGITLSLAELSLVYLLNFFLSALLWITPGGIGVAEGGQIGILKLVGIEEGGAVAFAFMTKAVELSFVGLGILYMVRIGMLHRFFKERRSS